MASYPPPPMPPRRGIGALTIVLIVVGIVALGAGVVFGVRSLMPSLQPLTAAGIESSLYADPDSARMATALKRDFPDDYRRLINGAAAMTVNGQGNQLKVVMFNEMRRLVTANRAGLQHTPDDAVLAHERAYVRVIEALAVNPSLCGKFFMTGLSPDDQLPPGAKGPVADLAVATLDAERAGLDRPATRATTLPPSDGQALVAAMRAQGAGAAMIEAFQNGATASLPATDQCALGRAMASGVAAMPPDQAARVWGFILAGLA